MAGALPPGAWWEYASSGRRPPAPEPYGIHAGKHFIWRDAFSRVVACKIRAHISSCNMSSVACKLCSLYGIGMAHALLLPSGLE